MRSSGLQRLSDQVFTIERDDDCDDNPQAGSIAAIPQRLLCGCDVQRTEHDQRCGGARMQKLSRPYAGGVGVEPDEENPHSCHGNCEGKGEERPGFAMWPGCSQEIHHREMPVAGACQCPARSVPGGRGICMERIGRFRMGSRSPRRRMSRRAAWASKVLPVPGSTSCASKSCRRSGRRSQSHRTS